MPTATTAAPNGAAATDAAAAPVTETVAAALSRTGMVAGDIVTGTTEALSPIVRSTAGMARELSDGFAAAVKEVAGLTVEAYHQGVEQQLAFSVGLADAVKVDWVSELTRRNAEAIGDLVAVSAPRTGCGASYRWTPGQAGRLVLSGKPRSPGRWCPVIGWQARGRDHPVPAGSAAPADPRQQHRWPPGAVMTPGSSAPGPHPGGRRTARSGSVAGRVAPPSGGVSSDAGTAIPVAVG